MNRVVARNLLSRRFLRYEVTKNHYDANHVRHQILEKGKIVCFLIPNLALPNVLWNTFELTV